MCIRKEYYCVLCSTLVLQAEDADPCPSDKHCTTKQTVSEWAGDEFCHHPACPSSPAFYPLKQSTAQQWFLHNSSGWPYFAALLHRFLRKALRVIDAPACSSLQNIDDGYERAGLCWDVHHAHHVKFIRQEFLRRAFAAGRADKIRFPQAVIECLQFGDYPSRKVMRALAASFGAVFWTLVYQACHAKGEDAAWRQAVQRRWDNADFLVRHVEFQSDEPDADEVDEHVANAAVGAPRGVRARLIWTWAAMMPDWGGPGESVDYGEVFPRFVETAEDGEDEEEMDIDEDGMDVAVDGEFEVERPGGYGYGSEASSSTLDFFTPEDSLTPADFFNPPGFPTPDSSSA